MKVREFLKANTLKQRDLANYLGVTEAAISNVVKGKSFFSQENLIKILNNPHGWDVSMLSEEEAQSRDEVEEVRANDKSMPERLLDIIEGQKQQIETLLEMLKEKDEEINRLRAELDARKGGTASDAQASSCANVG